MTRPSIVLLLACCLATHHAAAQSPDRVAEVLKQARERATEATRDVSGRSAFALPSIDFKAEFAKDKKSASVKAGHDLTNALVAEVGLSGAFDEDELRSILTTFRALAPGSGVWGALTFKRHRLSREAVTVQVGRQQAICQQAAWAAGEGLQFDCRERTLPRESFAQRLVAARESGLGLVCASFVRALGTGVTGTAGPRAVVDCLGDSALILAFVESQRAARPEILTASYTERVKTAKDDDQRLEVCNEFRRSKGQPPDAACDPKDFAEDKDWTTTWSTRFEQARTRPAADVCDAYDRARGVTPTGGRTVIPRSLTSCSTSVSPIVMRRHTGGSRRRCSVFATTRAAKPSTTSTPHSPNTARPGRAMR